MDAATKSDLVYRVFLHNIGVASRRWGVEIDHSRGLSRTLLERFPDASFDIVYIDGSHYYQDVLGDIAQAKRLARNGGIICGDDLEVQLRELDRDLVMSNLDRDYYVDRSSGLCFHPGVTLAVGESFPAVMSLAGYWLVRKDGPGDFREEALVCDQFFVPSFLNEAAQGEFVRKLREHFPIG